MTKLYKNRKNKVISRGKFHIDPEVGLYMVIFFLTEYFVFLFLFVGFVLGMLYAILIKLLTSTTKQRF